MPGTQYTGHSLEIAVLVVLLLGSMISCSIRTVPVRAHNHAQGDRPLS